MDNSHDALPNPVLNKMLNNYIDRVEMENNNEFSCIIIKPGSIKDISYIDVNYAAKLMKLDLFTNVKVNNDNFLEVIASNLQVKKYESIKNLSVKKEYIGEEPNYLYEMLYVDIDNTSKDCLEFKKDENENENELASLFNINGDKVYSNAIIYKNHLPSLSDSMTLESVTTNDLQRILHHRVHTKVVLFDETLQEITVEGDLGAFAERFFEGEFYKKLEIPFLMHNLNIWYTLNDFEDNNVCGNIIKKPIDKCIFFTMKSDDFRCNLTLNEVKKIVELSKKLDDYNCPSEFYEEKIDSLGRKIINNKYKVLDFLYNKFIV